MLNNELREMLESYYWSNCFYSSENLITSTEILKDAVMDKSWIVRCAAVSLKNMNPHLLSIALNDIEVDVRWRAYHNPNMDKEMKMIYRLSHVEPNNFWKKNPYD